MADRFKNLFNEDPARGPVCPRWLILGLVRLVSTLVLFLFSPGYMFPPYALLDSWIYTGYNGTCGGISQNLARSTTSPGSR